MDTAASRFSPSELAQNAGTGISDTIERAPMPSALVVFGAGLGLGLLATLLLKHAEVFEPEPPMRRYRRQAWDALSHVPNSLSHVPGVLSHVPESLSQATHHVSRMFNR